MHIGHRQAAHLRVRIALSNVMASFLRPYRTREARRRARWPVGDGDAVPLRLHRVPTGLGERGQGDAMTFDRAVGAEMNFALYGTIRMCVYRDRLRRTRRYRMGGIRWGHDSFRQGSGWKGPGPSEQGPSDR
jgi:hypothetical protein